MNPRGDFGITHSSQTHLVERLNRVERIALNTAVHSRRIRKIKHRVARSAELDSLINSRQKAASPIGISAAWPFGTRAENNKAGQILRFAPQAVGRPCAHARPAEEG